MLQDKCCWINLLIISMLKDKLSAQYVCGSTWEIPATKFCYFDWKILFATNAINDFQINRKLGLFFFFFVPLRTRQQANNSGILPLSKVFGWKCLKERTKPPKMLLVLDIDDGNMGAEQLLQINGCFNPGLQYLNYMTSFSAQPGSGPVLTKDYL